MQKFQILNYNEVIKKKINNYETSFTIHPLERGFANTLGNSVRRILLSSITSIAPFAIKIKGAQHEFQTLPGVKEDVVKLILNIKKIRFFYNRELFKDEDVVKIVLKTDKSKIYAKDFEIPTGLEIVNLEEYVATLAKNSTINLELFLTSGRGFVSFEENKDFIKTVSGKIDSKIELGTLIAIDSDFSPVQNVSFDVVELNTSSAIIQEKLIINVKTDKSVDAKDALAEAAQILKAHFDVMANVSNLDKQEIFMNQEEVRKKPPTKVIPLSQLDLSVRSFNSLKRASFNTLEEVSALTIKELHEIRNLGKKSAEEILEKLEEFGIILQEGE